MNAGAAFLKDIRTKAVLAAVTVVLLIVLYVTVHSPSTHSASGVATNSAVTSTGSLVATSAMATSSRSTNSSSTASTSTNSTVIKSVTSNQARATVAPITSAPTASTVSARELSASGTSLLKALVNIVCVSDDPSIPTISGSGVIIDSRGIILTAAHVAQFFLLQDYLGPDKVECIIRTGSPARRAYVAEPIYVSPSWVNANLTTLTQAAPKGTGENDFALLAITGTATTTPLASSFPAVPLASENPQSGEQVAIGSYGAQYLTSSELNYSLYPILVFGDIQNLFTFSSTNNTVDLVSVAGSAASQEGSSGGGIVNGAGELLGIITTSSVGGDISTRSLNAITIGHMRRSYLMDTGNDLDSVLASESLSALVANFAQESKSLGAKIVQNL